MVFGFGVGFVVLFAMGWMQSGGHQLATQLQQTVPRIPTDEERARYQAERNATTQQPTIVHRGVSGLGHRLARMSGLFHASKIMKLTRMAASWGWECGPNENGDPDIFDHLFGRGPLVVRPLQPNALWTGRPELYQNAPKKILRVVNNAPGYQPLMMMITIYFQSYRT